MNIQHSAKSDSWRTPPYVLTLVKAVLGEIDLDPASDEKANVNVGAKQIFTREQNGLLKAWPAGSVYLNPPGGKIDNQALAALFWARLMAHLNTGRLTHAIFLAFSTSALQTTQKKGCKPIMDFTFCVPAERIRFVHKLGLDMDAPSHSNVIVYVPGTVDKTDLFIETFQTLGVCKK